MPKKFGTNSKKEEAREREVQKKKDEKSKKEMEMENNYWRETDEKVIKKLEKEKEKEKKREEAIKRKQENKEIAEKEMNELIKSKQPEKRGPTRGEIEEYKRKAMEKILQDAKKDDKIEPPIEIDLDKEFVNENYLKFNTKTSEGVDIIDISGVNDALEQLTMTEYEKHPEKRMRAAWNEFFEKKLPEYKKEYPSLKRSQLIDMIQREFRKSPDNPVYKQKIINSKNEANKDQYNGNSEEEN